MAFIYGQRLLEYAIRIGTYDLITNPEMVRLAFFTDPQQNKGMDLTPPGSTVRVKEPLPTDVFIEKLNKIPKSKSETGQMNPFRNSIPSIPDVIDYLKNANMSIRFGFPREPQDLPCIAITLGNEDESSNQYLGTSKGQLKVKTSPQGDFKLYDIIGSDWSTQYHLHIMSPNADEVEIWYFILKYCFTAYRPALSAYGLQSPKLSFADLEPAPEYLQAGLFVYQRVGILACTKEEDMPLIPAGSFDNLSFQVSKPEFPEGDGTIIPNPPPLEPTS